MLIGAAATGVLVWLATQFSMDTTGGFWAGMGLLAAAGLVLALAQIAGGWTKWGKPRVTGGAFLLGFLPALVLGGWILLAAQPEGGWMQSQAQSWLGDIGLGGFVDTIAPVLPAIALALGLLFGYTFDTTGARVVDTQPGPFDDRAEVRREDREHVATTDADTRPAADEPVAAERTAVRDDAEERVEGDYHEPDRSLVTALSGREERDRETAPERRRGDVEVREGEPRDDDGDRRGGLFRRR